MQRHAPTQSTAKRVRTLAGAFAVLAIGTALYAQNVRAQATANIPPTASYSCDFENSYCDFYEQSKLGTTGRRSTLVASAASGATGIKLTTLTGDSSVNGSGTWERNDLMKPKDPSYCQPGQEEWWAFSIMFPDDYVFPPGPEAGIVMDFHHSGSSGQANYEIQTIPGIGLRARGYGGAEVNTGKYDALIPDPHGAATGTVARNAWYHFVLHVRWSPNGDGFMEGWVNGKKYQSYQGATQYAGQTCYLKLANYHGPFGQASSVIHDRVVRGASASDVTHLALEGVAGTGTPTPPAPTRYALSTITMGSGSGTVSSSPSGINCGSSCNTTFAPGSAVTLTASPASGSTFSGWSGVCGGTGACTVTMNQAKSVTATFAAASPPPPTTPPATGAVTVSATTLYSFGTTRTQAVTYTNNTGVKVTFMQASMSSARYGQTNNCGEVAAGARCTATVTYNPAIAGADLATFTMTSSAPNSPHLVSLTATTAPASAPASKLVNLSTRGLVLTGDDVMIGGFVIEGTAPKTVVIRARGPSLAQFGVANVLANPVLQLYQGQAVLATNDDHGTAANAAQLRATGHAPTDARESAILATLAPGAYTAIVSGAGGSTGVGIVEAFEVDRPDSPMVNISARGRILTGDNVMISGFVIEGSAPRNVVVRVRGPSLSQLGVPGVLSNPTLVVVRSSDQAVLATNDDWPSAGNAAALGATGQAPSDPREAAVLLTLAPGAYTAIAAGAGGATGVGIVEVFAVP